MNKLFKIYNPKLGGFVDDPSEWFVNSEGKVFFLEVDNHVHSLIEAPECQVHFLNEEKDDLQ
jgi:hypothetical protein